MREKVGTNDSQVAYIYIAIKLCIFRNHELQSGATAEGRAFATCARSYIVRKILCIDLSLNRSVVEDNTFPEPASC